MAGSPELEKMAKGELTKATEEAVVEEGEEGGHHGPS